MSPFLFFFILRFCTFDFVQWFWVDIFKQRKIYFYHLFSTLLNTRYTLLSPLVFVYHFIHRITSLIEFFFYFTFFFLSFVSFHPYFLFPHTLNVVPWFSIILLLFTFVRTGFVNCIIFSFNYFFQCSKLTLSTIPIPANLCILCFEHTHNSSLHNFSQKSRATNLSFFYIGDLCACVCVFMCV